MQEVLQHRMAHVYILYEICYPTPLKYSLVIFSYTINLHVHVYTIHAYIIHVHVHVYCLYQTWLGHTRMKAGPRIHTEIITESKMAGKNDVCVQYSL